MSAATRLSAVRPWARMSQPMPPPRVKPAMPVVEMSPPVVARPKACVSWSKSAQVAPASATARRAAGSTRMAVHAREVDDDAVVDGGEAGDGVPAAAHGDLEVLGAGELERAHHVCDAGAPDDERGTAVEGAVPDHAGLVVAGVGGGDDLAAQALAELLHGRVAERVRRWLLLPSGGFPPCGAGRVRRYAGASLRSLSRAVAIASRWARPRASSIASRGAREFGFHHVEPAGVHGGGASVGMEEDLPLPAVRDPPDPEDPAREQALVEVHLPGREQHQRRHRAGSGQHQPPHRTAGAGQDRQHRSPSSMSSTPPPIRVPLRPNTGRKNRPVAAAPMIEPSVLAP